MVSPLEIIYPKYNICMYSKYKYAKHNISKLKQVSSNI